MTGGRAEPADWTTVQVRTTHETSAVVAALFAAGAEGVQEVDDGVVTHLRDVDEARVSDLVRRADPEARVRFSPTPQVDWSAEWKSRITAHRVGKLVVTPPWLALDYAESERIEIDPGMAFGTGEHETTRGVLKLLQSVIREGDKVADLGAGSAILSIAAAKLGATRVAAIEIDPDAIENAEMNVSRNDVSERVTVIEGDAEYLLPLVAPVRVILANILAHAIIGLLPAMAAALDEDGFAILSGILAAERGEVEEALARGGWRIVATEKEGIWWSATVTR